MDQLFIYISVAEKLSSWLRQEELTLLQKTERLKFKFSDHADLATQPCISSNAAKIQLWSFTMITNHKYIMQKIEKNLSQF